MNVSLSSSFHSFSFFFFSFTKCAQCFPWASVVFIHVFRVWFTWVNFVFISCGFITFLLFAQCECETILTLPCFPFLFTFGTRISVVICVSFVENVVCASALNENGLFVCALREEKVDHNIGFFHFLFFLILVSKHFLWICTERAVLQLNSAFVKYCVSIPHSRF